MGKVFEEIDEKLRTWIEAREMFFVSTAPSGDDGLVNCSPKGLDTFKVLDPTTVAYLDITGSGIETVAHLKQNGRIVVMFCAFQGPPKILRIHGSGIVHEPGTDRFDELVTEFPTYPGVRSVIEIKATRIADSCGYGVPLMKFEGQRETLVKLSEQKGDDGLAEYRLKKNMKSLDNLPGLNPPTAG